MTNSLKKIGIMTSGGDSPDHIPWYAAVGVRGNYSRNTQPDTESLTGGHPDLHRL